MSGKQSMQIVMQWQVQVAHYLVHCQGLVLVNVYVTDYNCKAF